MMRVVIDTNILVSSLLVKLGFPVTIYRAWRAGHFTLVTCEEQIDELRATLRKPYEPDELNRVLTRLVPNLPASTAREPGRATDPGEWGAR